jgi:hypothetical protein
VQREGPQHGSDDEGDDSQREEDSRESWLHETYYADTARQGHQCDNGSADRSTHRRPIRDQTIKVLQRIENTGRTDDANEPALNRNRANSCRG